MQRSQFETKSTSRFEARNAAFRAPNRDVSRFEAGNAAFPASNRDLSQGSTYTYIDIYTYIYFKMCSFPHDPNQDIVSFAVLRASLMQQLVIRIGLFENEHFFETAFFTKRGALKMCSFPHEPNDDFSF